MEIAMASQKNVGLVTLSINLCQCIFIKVYNDSTLKFPIFHDLPHISPWNFIVTATASQKKMFAKFFDEFNTICQEEIMEIRKFLGYVTSFWPDPMGHSRGTCLGVLQT